MISPTLYIVMCGVPLASRIGDGIVAARDRGWQPFVVPTDASRNWFDADALASDVPVVSDHRKADDDERLQLLMPTASVAPSESPTLDDPTP